MAEVQPEKQKALEILRKKWSILDSSTKADFHQEMLLQSDWEWEDVVDDLVPETDKTPDPMIAVAVEDDAAIKRYDKVMFQAEKSGHIPRIKGGVRVLIGPTGLETERVPRDDDYFPDVFRSKDCGDILNFVLVTKGVEMPKERMLLFRSEGIPVSQLRIKFTMDEVPIQYNDFLQRAMAHFHFMEGWLLGAGTPQRKNEALHARYWLQAAIDGLILECQLLFPQHKRERKRFPPAWKSQRLGGVLTWSEFLATQPLLNTWIHSLMTSDDCRDIAAINPSKDGEEQANIAWEVGRAAALRLRDADEATLAARAAGEQELQLATSGAQDTTESAAMEVDNIPDTENSSTTPPPECDAPMDPASPASSEILPPKLKLQKKRSMKLRR